MNRYGAIAQDHWRKHLPTRYSKLEDPTPFFEDLGEQIMTHVQALTEGQTRRERPTLNTMNDLDRIGRLNAIRKSAEEQAFADLIWPEGSTEEEPTSMEISSPEPAEWLDGETKADWLTRLGLVQLPNAGLMPLDPNHPLWEGWNREQDQPIDMPVSQHQHWQQTYRQWFKTLPHQVADA